MLFGERLAVVRKKKKISQDELAKAIGAHAPVIGRYERNEVKPSIEAAKKIADAFEVSLDYLVGEGINASFDKKTLKRLQDIHKLDKDIQDKLFFLIDTVIRDNKARKAYSA